MLSKKIGDWGEEKACMLLKQCGYAVIVQNYHSRFGEIDIIAVREKTLFFIEVKTRSKTEYGSANEVISKSKQNKIIKTALIFLQKNTDYADFACQFDVICIDFYQDVAKKVQQDISELVYDLEWIENAFTLDQELFTL